MSDNKAKKVDKDSSLEPEAPNAPETVVDRLIATSKDMAGINYASITAHRASMLMPGLSPLSQVLAPAKAVSEAIEKMTAVPRLVEKMMVSSVLREKLSGAVAANQVMESLAASVAKPPWLAEFGLNASVKEVMARVAGTEQLRVGILNSSFAALAINSAYTGAIASIMAQNAPAHLLSAARLLTSMKQIAGISDAVERLRPTPIFDSLRLPASTAQFTATHVVRVFDTGKEVEEELPTLELVEGEYLGDFERELTSVDQNLVEPWRGAQYAVAQKGPDYLRHFAVSLRAIADHVLHRLSPDKAVKAWTKDEKMYDRGKPTRRCRLLYIVRELGPDVAKLLKADIDAAIYWFDYLSKEDHRLGGVQADAAIRAITNRFQSVVLFMIHGSRGFK